MIFSTRIQPVVNIKPHTATMPARVGKAPARPVFIGNPRIPAPIVVPQISKETVMIGGLSEFVMLILLFFIMKESV